MNQLNRREWLHGAFASAVAAPSTHDDVFDVVVYSGVPCGVAAAVAAAREGARVLLIEPTRHVGGLNTSGINTAESEHMLHWTIGGLALEFYRGMGDHYGTGKPEFYFESSVAEKVFLQMLKRAGVSVVYGQRVEKVEKRGARIESIHLSDGRSVQAKVFVDAGYEGDLMVRAGVDSTFGRESRATYGEEYAGVRFDRTPIPAQTVDAQGQLLSGIKGWTKDLKEGDAHPGVLNYNYRLTFSRDPKTRVPIPNARDYNPARYALLENWLRQRSAAKHPVQLRDLVDLYGRRNGKFEVNNKQAAIISLGYFGGQFGYPEGSYSQRDAIIEDHWNYTLGLFQFLSSHESVPANLKSELSQWGLHTGEFADNGHLPYQLYVREARRMRGGFVMKERDVIADRRKADAVGISSHFIDAHHVQRLAVSPTAFVNEGRIWRIGWAYQIPYRALLPKPEQCVNLLVPGAASFSHVAYCSYRLESVWMIGGHAAGVAAAMAASAKREVAKVDVKALQGKLRAQKQVVDFVAGAPERWSDPRGGTGGPPEF